MNKQRRKEIEKIVNELQELMERLQDLAEQEQEAYDNLPESIQESERGEAISDCAYELDDATTDVEAVMDKLQEIIDTY